VYLGGGMGRFFAIVLGASVSFLKMSNLFLMCGKFAFIPVTIICISSNKFRDMNIKARFCLTLDSIVELGFALPVKVANYV